MTTACDAADSVVVTTARRALAEQELSLALPYVSEGDEPELERVFQEHTAQRLVWLGDQGDTFVQSVVRLHLSAEGVQFSGLKPAGTQPSPAVPIAERAVLSGHPSALALLFTAEVRPELLRRFEMVRRWHEQASDEVAPLRAYLLALHRFLVWVDRNAVARK
jgi:hypothetical protein